MTLTKTKLVAEIVGLLVFLVVVQWLSTVLLHTRAFWPLMVYSALYIGVRAAILAKRTGRN